MFEKIRNRAYEARLESAQVELESEASELGVDVVSVGVVALERPSLARSAGRLLKLATGLATQTQATYVQNYHLQAGELAFLYTESLAGPTVALPGEFHIRIAGNFSHAVALGLGDRGPEWLVDHLPLAERIAADE